MENLNKQRGLTVARRSHVRHARGGKIALVTLVAMLGLVVLAGFVGNAGQVVSSKVASQNAADSVAFSSAQWMARGMNSITATNHLLGEVTGLVVAVEALGGPEMDEGMEYYSPQFQALDTINRQLKNYAPANGGYGASALGQIEKPLINALVDQMAPESEEDKKAKAFATIYDSQLQLKLDLSKWLLVKTIANLGFYVPPPWGFATAIAAYAVHIAADVQLAFIAKEWFVIKGIEVLVRNPVTKQVKDKFETLLVPALAGHGDFIAGRMNKSSGSPKQAEKSIVNIAVGDSLLHLGKTYDVKAFIFPAANNFRMPIEAEPAPSLQGTTGANEPEWGKDEPVTLGDSDEAFNDINEKINDSRSDIQDRIQELKDGLALLDRLEADINKLSQEEGVTTAEKQAFDDEKREIARARTDKQRRLAKLEKELAEMNKKQQELIQLRQSLAQMPPGTGNLSAKPEHLALAKMKQSEERYTQWVRATFPYVDSFRAPILKQFDEWLPRSGAANHYEKWTNRYTLTNAWQFRSGYRFAAKGGSKTDGEWTKSNKKSDKPLEMYVMLGAYANQPAASGRRDQKGREKWTENSDAGKKLAEELFTVIGITHREIEPLFSPVIYPQAAQNGGTTTFAQAIYYNGNEQVDVSAGAKSTNQPKIGWDTLNWDPTINVPEWGAKVATSGAKWPWEIFTSDKALSSSSKVHLNWQAKLMPVTKTRFRGVVTTPMSPEMNLDVLPVELLYSKMVTH
jgi:hypothetical protein